MLFILDEKTTAMIWCKISFFQHELPISSARDILIECFALELRRLRNAAENKMAPYRAYQDCMRAAITTILEAKEDINHLPTVLL